MAPSSRRRRYRTGDGDVIIMPPADDASAGSAADGHAASVWEELKSFVFEVSAGRPKGVADATDLQICVDSPEHQGSRRRASRRRMRAAATEIAANSGSADNEPQRLVADSSPIVDAAPHVSKPVVGTKSHDVGAAPPTPQISQVRVKRRPKPRREGLSAVFAGCGFNGLVLVLLLAGKIPGVPPLDELLWATAPAVEEMTLTEVNFEATAEDVLVDGDDATEELIDPGQAAFGELDTTAALADMGAEATLAAGALGGELGALLGETGAGLTKLDDGLGDAPMAKFFGQQIEGRRIVFVLDNSGSMQGGRLETVIAELLRSVESLNDDQEFYVIFHSDTIYPLFYPDPVDRYIRPTAANKRALARWLDTVELCLGDSVDEALAAAAMIEPDTVFLLSDGRIQGNKKIRFLLDGQSRNFPIHTFAVGMGSSIAGRRNLEDVAAANGGDFRESEIPAEMRDLARERLRPYHSERPGHIWGRNVKPFRPRG